MLDSIYVAEFTTYLQIQFHTPEKKPVTVNYATQYHHLVTKFLTRDKVKPKRKQISNTFVLVVHLCNNILNITTH